MKRNPSDVEGFAAFLPVKAKGGKIVLEGAWFPTNAEGKKIGWPCRSQREAYRASRRILAEEINR